MPARIYQTFWFSERSWKSIFKWTISQLLSLAIYSAFLEPWGRPHRYDQKVYGFMMLHMVKLRVWKAWQLRRKTICWKFKQLISRLMNVESSVFFSTVDIQWLGLVMDEVPVLATPGQNIGISSNIFAFLSPALITERWEKKVNFCIT